MKPWRCLPLLMLLWVATAGALEFPALSGRVVDQAGLLDGQTRSQLSQMLEAHEQATSEQVVVVTVPDRRWHSCWRGRHVAGAGR